MSVRIKFAILLVFILFVGCLAGLQEQQFRDTTPGAADDPILAMQQAILRIEIAKLVMGINSCSNLMLLAVSVFLYSEVRSLRRQLAALVEVIESRREMANR